MPLAPMATRDRGDIVAEYPHLVIPFAVFQLIGWCFCMLEVFGAVGPVGYTVMDATYPIDIAFCQLMFWGTLHHGPISDGRLSLVCRVAFCVEAIIIMTTCIAVFRPNAVADALSDGNITSLFGLEFDELPKMFLGYIEAAWWFVVFVPFAAWIGTTTLRVGRRRLVQRLPAAELSPFSTKFIRWYILIFAIQGAISILSIYRVAAAQTEEEKILVSKVNYALRAVSLVFSMIPGVHAIIFTAAGVTHAQFRAGKAPRATYAAATCAVVYAAVVTFDLVLVLVASSSTDPILNVHGVVELFGLENLPMMGVWLCAAYQFGLKFGHIVGKFEKTEERLRQRDGKAQRGSSSGATQLTSAAAADKALAA